MQGEDTKKEKTPASGVLHKLQSSEVLATWDFEKCFLICKWREEAHWGYFASIGKVS